MPSADGGQSRPTPWRQTKHNTSQIKSRKPPNLVPAQHPVLTAGLPPSHRRWRAPETRPPIRVNFQRSSRSASCMAAGPVDLSSATLVTRRRRWHPSPVLLPGESHGQRSLVGCSPWGREGSDTNERLHFHFSLSCIREGNGNPLQCFILENPRDGEAWRAASIGWHRVRHD